MKNGALILIGVLGLGISKAQSQTIFVRELWDGISGDANPSQHEHANCRQSFFPGLCGYAMGSQPGGTAQLPVDGLSPRFPQ